ncbi:MAG: type IV pilus twitching motility protein PilT [Atribacterota bacterium]|nr:type IV pilus twitching motility protein PilT [Atribacterota bacterium]MDD4897053.1 type IV pilus twitching motility protein PilT [Atribacterota bacterium]MDD5636311.1 type IV pilus twitching motility protein PilT [Atribacterota bacterium]
MNITELLKITNDMEASDLHVTVGIPPTLRINGLLSKLNYPELTENAVYEMIYSILSEEQRKKFEELKEIDFSLEIVNIARFRVNVFMHRSGIAGAFRLIPGKIKTLEELGLPKNLVEFTKKPKGLVLITGPTGSGKSTTISSFIDIINENQKLHIITIEDPIEFIHQHKNCIIDQREVGLHTKSFTYALRSALREDPDVILVGEMRDLETISMAVTAAETGHLVFSTLHTNSAAETVERIIDVFPAHQQRQIRIQLAESLQGVISQTLLPNIDQTKRVPAVEIMIATPAIKNIIREERIHMIPASIQGAQQLGMQTMDQSLRQLYQNHVIDRETALFKASDPKFVLSN